MRNRRAPREGTVEDGTDALGQAGPPPCTRHRVPRERRPPCVIGAGRTAPGGGGDGKEGGWVMLQAMRGRSSL
eukprot:2420684-Prymnesium_polylepis.2